MQDHEFPNADYFIISCIGKTFLIEQFRKLTDQKSFLPISYFLRSFKPDNRNYSLNMFIT